MKLPLGPIVMNFLPGERITNAAILSRLFWCALHGRGARVVVGLA